MIARELNEQGIPTIKGNPWTSSSVMGIINNEKYKGDILLGKTFTVDPISKRRLENLGEEDRFYIKNHHEPIVSEETFARAQEIRERRNGGRKKGVAPGKREKFSRQYAFSCMLECGFCGANLSRRRWHSSSKYTKTIWQCVESTKHGKRFCPDSKGIPEQVIEDAFIESYRMLCTDHKDVLEEFIKRVEKTLSEDSIEDKIEKLNRSVYNIQYKRKKLLENYLEGVVAKDIYEETDVGYEKKLSEAKTQLSMLEQQYDNEGSLQRRLADFRKALSKNQILEEFDRGIFESIIEKVIVGGYDENGEKDPYKIIFVYKTGFKNEIGNAKERFGKKSKAVEKAKKLGLENFSILGANKTMPNAYKALEGSADAFLYPGHVNAITGTAVCEELVKKGVSGVVTGFTAAELLTALAVTIELSQRGEPFFRNCYPRVVKPEGNPAAIKLMEKVMTPCDSEWRGLGIIPMSGMILRDEYADFDARKKFALPKITGKPNPACRCGDVLQGKCKPSDCKVFGKVCTPLHPIGACMVSNEGACSAYYQYGNL